MWNDAPLEFVPNDAGGLSFQIFSPLLETPLVVDGLEKVSCKPDEDKFTLSSVASGMTTPNRIRTTKGTASIEVSDASPSMETLSTLANAGVYIGFVFKDPTTPKLNCESTYCFLKQGVSVERGKETGTTMFEITCPILKTETGGFSVVVRP